MEMTLDNEIREVKVYMFEKDYQAIVKAYEAIREIQKDYTYDANSLWTINIAILETIRLDFTEMGIHAQVTDEEAKLLIEYENKK